MSRAGRRLGIMAVATAMGLALAGMSACVADGYDYGYAGGVGYDAGFYEPYGYDYGAWGPGYRVGPERDGGRRDGRGDGRGPGDSRPGGFRPAPAGRSTPSIPSGGRGGDGGGHGGGGGGHGGGGGGGGGGGHRH